MRKLPHSHISARKRHKSVAEVVGEGFLSMAKRVEKLVDILSVTAVGLKSGNNNNSREDKAAVFRQDFDLMNSSTSDLKLMMASFVESQ